MIVPMIVMAFAVACSSGEHAAPTGSPPGLVSASVPASPAPVLPAGIPGSFDQDVAGADLPANELIPPETRVADRLLTPTAAGEAAVVDLLEAGQRPLRAGLRGCGVAARGRRHSPVACCVRHVTLRRRRLLAIQGITGDATGDGSADALLFEATGGVGNCGRWRVIDLAAGVQRWLRETCDAQIDISVDPPGLVLTETVYEPGDPHCCPSSIRTSVLAYRAPDRFVAISEEAVPL